MFYKVVAFLSANIEFVIVSIAVAIIVGAILKGVKRIVGAALSFVLVLAITGNVFGVPMEQIKEGYDYVSTQYTEIKDSGWFTNTVEKIKFYWNSGKEAWDVATTPGAATEGETDVEISVIEGDYGTFNVHFIDVGQADAILIENGEDVMLIDSGNYADAGIMVNYLNGLGIEDIDYFVTTHPHEDHIGCAATIVYNFDVEVLVKTDATATTACYKKMMQAVEETDAEIWVPAPGDEFELGDATFLIVGPISYDKDEMNNNSIVIRMEHGNNSFLFTGDAEREEESAILDAGFFLEVDVLKVGHHGSNSSTTYPFLREIMPRYAVIMVGEDNSYGHPTEGLLSRLRDAGVQEVYRTDMNGTIVMESDGYEITVYTEK